MSLRSNARSLAVFVSVVGSLAGPAEPGEKNVLVTGPDALAIVRALDGARRKLRTPACQQVLTDFTDADGRSLAETLGPTEPADYLELLVIRDGEVPKGSRRCAHLGAGAFTEPGIKLVFVCGGNFRGQSPGARENSLIHEMLHSLGLGENPPSSLEISRQVARRCGS